MLQHLEIENYALIKSLSIDFNAGFTVITGETGSGKSIILGALGLLLGQRADVQVLLDKEIKCVVEGTFDISKLALHPFFEENDLDYDDTLILRREIQPSGKSRAFINDSPASLQMMKELGAFIIDIHSQHQTLTLTSADSQLKILDVLSVCDDARKAYAQEYEIYKSLKNKLSNLEEQDKKNRQDYDYYTFLYDELKAMQLQENEQEELEEELKLLSNSENIKYSLSSVIQGCDDSDDSVISRLLSCKSLLTKVSSYHSSLEQVAERFSSTIIEFKDIISELKTIDGQVQYSPERQEEVNNRLDSIYKLETKHGVSTVGELIGIKNDLEERLQAVLDMDEMLEKARQELAESEERLKKYAADLTAVRESSVSYLEQQLAPILCDLGMKEAVFKVNMSKSEKFLPIGIDEVNFMFNANRGGEIREIGKVISGGELSRVMLAIKSVIASRSLLPTIIFDEIDTGVSGEISIKVGNIMKRMTSTTQVLAITHLPQIAAKADTHLKVYKQIEGERTLSRMTILDTDSRVEEIAKMLSSEKMTESALATAKELMMDA
ncbi:MAG: DNA repair protein RecN [Bacteroidales bacterium]|nr:DNA repair protein RecN [Bacteroidales bacterium]